jgi:pimeloyl-ACP methyl ester carboxylesterase
VPATITEHSYQSSRHTSFYLAAGPTDGVPIIFVHGWPELSLSWRHQLPFLADLGYRTIAPDMRGYGKSSIYTHHADYALREVATDMIELIDGLGIEKAIWVGHDWGSPVVWSIARHHPERCIAVANLCVPYFTLERGWPGLLPHIDRTLYPADEYPAGQWEYQCFYAEQFARATATFDADPYRVIKLLFRKGNPEGAGQISATARTRHDNGWFGGGEIPDLPIDHDVVTEEDLDVYAAGLSKNTFFGPDSYYMNHSANEAFAAEATDEQLNMPVLFLHGRYDYTCETLVSSAAEPMRKLCSNLVEHIVDSGHWMAAEQPGQVNQHLSDWLTST